MRYKITITEQADRDIRKIYEYIANDLQSPDAAAGLLSRFEKEIFGLENMPERFHRYEKEPWNSRNLRVMPVEHYLVFYIPDNGTHTVRIIRIMYRSRDLDTQLNEEA